MAVIKSYHCGGETLGTVVKHSVRDSNANFFLYLVVKVSLNLSLKSFNNGCHANSVNHQSSLLSKIPGVSVLLSPPRPSVYFTIFTILLFILVYHLDLD